MRVESYFAKKQEKKSRHSIVIMMMMTHRQMMRDSGKNSEDQIFRAFGRFFASSPFHEEDVTDESASRLRIDFWLTSLQ